MMDEKKIFKAKYSQKVLEFSINADILAKANIYGIYMLTRYTCVILKFI